MSFPQKSSPAKLVVGLFMKDKHLIGQLAKDLVDEFGPIDIVSTWFPFDFTTYYESEMDAPLYRRMFVFKQLVEQNKLADIKLLTNGIERRYLEDNNRCVNIDPGYLLLERFVLATGKNFTHRIYLDQGIYADLTLIYQKGRFQKLPWTYPDYSAKNMMAFLTLVRDKYIKDLKETKNNNHSKPNH